MSTKDFYTYIIAIIGAVVCIVVLPLYFINKNFEKRANEPSCFNEPLFGVNHHVKDLFGEYYVVLEEAYKAKKCRYLYQVRSQDSLTTHRYEFELYEVD